MNIFTHVVFGVLFAALFFGSPEALLLVAMGCMLPDLDREYGFLSKNYFSRLQIHRAFCHNFLFIGLVYLVNPFLGLGTLLHTLLDILTAARDRGVEWLFPFTRFVKHAAYDINGNRMKLNPKHRIYLLQADLPLLTKNTAKDLKPTSELPWRRTYGFALSGGLLDKGILIGSLVLTAMLVISSAIGLRQFVEFRPMSMAFLIPMLFGTAGIIINFFAGEIDRKRQRETPNRIKHDRVYEFVFFFSVGLMVLGAVLGGIMNPAAVTTGLENILYIAIGGALMVLVAVAVVKIYARKPLPKGGKDPSIV